MPEQAQEHLCSVPDHYRLAITDADVAQNFCSGRNINAIPNARRGEHTIPVSDGHLLSDHDIFAECCIGADNDSKGMGEKYGLWQPLVNLTIQISLEELSYNGNRVVGEKYQQACKQAV